MTRSVVELNKSNFEQEVLGAVKPVLVEFWAGWSSPCQAMAPIVESIAGDEHAPVKVARVNVEHQEILAEEYGVRGVPTLLIFHHGGLQDQIVGRATEREVREKLWRYV